MKITVHLPLSHIKACLIFAGVSDVRYYLNGLFVEAYGDRVFLVGTDGHRMGVCRSPNDADIPPAQFIIPRTLLDGLKGSRIDKTAVVDFDTETQAVTVHLAGLAAVGKAIDGKYPDWRRVLPSTASWGAGQFNPQYVGDFAKAHKALGLRAEQRLVVHHNGEHAARAEFAGCPVFLGVLMPTYERRPAVHILVGEFTDYPREQAAA